MAIAAPAPVNALDVDSDGTFTLTHTRQNISATTRHEMEVTTFTHITPGLEPEYTIYVNQVKASEIEVDLASGLELLGALTRALETLMLLQPDHESTIEYRRTRPAAVTKSAPEKLEPWADAKPRDLKTFVAKENRTSPEVDAASVTAWMAQVDPNLTPEQLTIFHRWAKQAMSPSS